MTNWNTEAIELLEKKPKQQNWGARRAAKNKKYKSSSKFVEDYIVLDFETTGLRAGADKIIQIGAIKYVNHEVKDMFNTFINPFRHIPDSQLHDLQVFQTKWSNGHQVSSKKLKNCSNSSEIYQSLLTMHRLIWVSYMRSTTSKA